MVNKLDQILYKFAVLLTKTPFIMDTDIFDDFNELQTDYKAIKSAIYVIAKENSNLENYKNVLLGKIDDLEKQIENLKRVQIVCTDPV